METKARVAIRVEIRALLLLGLAPATALLAGVDAREIIYSKCREFEPIPPTRT